MTEEFNESTDQMDEESEETAEVVSEEVESEEISDDDLDQIADTVIDTLQSILKYFNVGEITIDEYEGDDNELIFDITGDDVAILIGRHGRTLDSLHTLVSNITARKIGYRYPIVIDVEGYRNRQRQKIESIARSSAKRAVSQGRSVSLRPMSPYERRLVHMALQNDLKVETHSEDEGANRHVVISPL